MKYKVGDKVLIKSLDWYYEHRDRIDQIDCGNACFVHDMTTLCEKIVTISFIHSLREFYRIKEDDGTFNWTDEMIERLVERDGKTYPYKIGDRVVLKGKNRCATITDLKYNSSGILSYYINIDNDKDNSIDYPTDLLLPYDDVETTNESKKMARFTFDDNDFANKVELDLSNRELIQEDGKWFVVKKKNEYPKTYGECCEILGVDPNNFLTITNCYEGEVETTDYERSLSSKFTSLWGLLICRDAYWKIAGEKMGLGKPWEYDCHSDCFTPAIIYKNRNAILTFPTEEMRDAFYENFKELIEICKDLL